MSAPFVRFSRDKRGYEHTYLMHVATGKGGGRPCVLYWYRTPPGAKVGREPFDEVVRRELEDRYPDLAFDWKRISEAQPPALPEQEHWRERRRTERAAKQARASEKRSQGEQGRSTEPVQPQEAPDQGDSDGEGVSQLDDTSADSATLAAGAGSGAPDSADPRSKRRRRRRRGRGRPTGELATTATGTPAPDAAEEIQAPVPEADPPVSTS